MKAVTDTKYYDEIAYTIGIYGSGEKLKPSQMASAINDIVHDAETRAENEGFKHGYGTGYAEGESAGIEQGRQSAYDEFWDNYQNKGARSNYTRAFSSSNFNATLFKPKYDFIASTLYQCFQENNSLTDITTKGDGTPLVMDGSNISTTTGFNRAFYGMAKIEKIGLIISMKDAPWTGTFQGVTTLKEVRLGGTIGKEFDIHWSTKLSRDSLLSILQACNVAVSDVTITLPSKCIDGKTVTETYIASDTELNTALTNATLNGYSIAYS